MTKNHLIRPLHIQIFRLLVASALAIGLTLGIALVSVVHAGTFTVNSTADVVDSNPGDGVCATVAGVCTLRAAIQEANALAGADIIILPSGIYTLTISGINEDAAAQGDLDITGTLTLSGAGAENTIINGDGLDRVFDISGVVTISGVTIKGGRIASIGGGIINGGSLILTDSRVIDNAVTGSSDGGGIYNAGRLQLINSTVLSNTADSAGGGIYNIAASGIVTLTASTLISNSASSCGGLFNESGTVNLVSSSVISNIGGGLCNFQLLGTGTLSLVDSTVRGNRRPSGLGGGINNVSILTVTRSLFFDNYADVGGAIFSSGPVTITNSTISSNSAKTGGGGLFLQFEPAYLNNVTIVDNVADSNNDGNGDGGGIYAGVGTMTFKNTLLSNNVDRGGERPDCRGTLTSQGYNLIRDTSGCTITGDNTGNISGQNPNLGSLQDNGGSSLTHALLVGSPAINAGSPGIPGSGGNACEQVDQRGVTRPQGTRCDIGAYEALIVQFNTAVQTVAENIGTVTMTVGLDVASSLTVTVPYTVSGTATGGGVDHNLANGSFTINAGSAVDNIVFSVVNDTLDEPDETIVVTLGMPTNGTLGTTRVQTVTIQDDDDPLPTVQFSTATQTVPEKVGPVTMTLNLSAASSLMVTVPYTVTGTAIGGDVDHNLTSGAVVINSGSTVGEISFKVISDTLDEADEIIIVTLGIPTNATLSTTAVQTVTIQDDDPPPTVQFSTATQTVIESMGTVTVTVNLSAASSLTVTVPYTVTGTATSNIDHNLLNGMFTIVPGDLLQSIAFIVEDDTFDEPDETILIMLEQVTNGILGATIMQTITIQDNDLTEHKVYLPLVLKQP